MADDKLLQYHESIIGHTKAFIQPIIVDEDNFYSINILVSVDGTVDSYVTHNNHFYEIDEPEFKPVKLANVVAV